MYNLYRQWYFYWIVGYVYAQSDSTTFMQYNNAVDKRHDSLMPPMAGC